MLTLLGYLAAAACVLAITSVVRRPGLIQLASVMLCDCSATVAIFASFGTDAAIAAQPVQHLVFGRLLMASRRARTERCGWLVIAGYGAGLALDLVHAAAGTPTSSYTLATNVVFIGQLAVVGITGGLDAVRTMVGALGRWVLHRLRDRGRQAPAFRAQK